MAKIKIKFKELLDEKYSLIRDYYKINFYDHNDPAHQIDHADEVYKNALRYIDNNNIITDTDVVFFMCYTHDIFAGKNREMHHLLAFEYVRNASDKYLKELSDAQLFLISEAVLKHRASSTMNTRSLYDTILRIADKGVPNLNKIIKRSYEYTRDKVPENQLENAVKKHIKEKYSRNGYAFNDSMYVNTYQEELEVFWNEVDEYLKES